MGKAESKDGHVYKCLGDHITDEQMEQIRAGTFEGMGIGDYWIINGVKFSIFCFDDSLKKSWIAKRKEEDELMKHHLILCPHDTKQEG